MASFRNFIYARYVRIARRSVIGTSRQNDATFLRQGMETIMNRLQMPKGVHFSRFTVNGIAAASFKPKKANENIIMLYFHGGAYALGSVETHKTLIARIARKAGIYALAIDYRLAPENPFPAALDDAISAYKWLLEKKYSPKNIIFAGDSAGGGLTLASILQLKQENMPLPAAAICISPWTDLLATGNSIEENENIDPMLTPNLIRYWADIYANGEDKKNPLISPLYGNFSDFPPIFIQVGTAEVLLDDAKRLADKARQAGVDVELEIWDEMTHVFQACGPYLPESRKAIASIAEYISKKIT
ncbi:MAG: alpha/beta hydrolase [Chitinophagales bacterium]